MSDSCTQDLNDFVENADHGVILFSLGTVVSELSMGVDKLNHIFEAFSRLKQRVIMKFDAESYKIQLPNVKVVKWFPQRDLLGIYVGTRWRNLCGRQIGICTPLTKV